MSPLRTVCAVGLCLPLAAGCAPSVTFLSCRCERMEADGRLAAVEFVSTFEAHGLAGSQVVYGVRLLSADGRPVRSPDPRFRTPEGTVGAARTFIAFNDPHRFDDLRVSIPAVELELRQGDLPATAEVSVRLPDGTTLGKRTCAVPVTDAEEVLPPLEQAVPDRREPDGDAD